MNLFHKDVHTAWCPGCGNFSILSAMQEAFAAEGLRPQDVYVFSGIGQAAKLPHYISSHGFNTLHGRSFPAAFGAHVANPEMKIVISTGDGDTYGEGGNHFLHGVRRNLDILHLVHDNQVYGLTKGQASPTTALGQVATLQHAGVRNLPIRPLLLALTLGATFVARAFTGNREQLIEIIRAGLNHRGYAFIDILQPCPSFNRINTFAWYKAHSAPLPEDHDPSDWQKALLLAAQDQPLHLGIFYQKEAPTFLDRVKHLDGPLFKKKRHPRDIEKYFR